MGISNEKDLIILIGEKGGLQARDNGIAYFTHRLKLGYKNTYYIYDKKNTDIDGLFHNKKNLIIKDSYRHKRLFYKADYLMLNDGYLDVFPSFNKKPLSKGWAPIVYLQHGIISYKKFISTKAITMGVCDTLVHHLKQKEILLGMLFSLNQI